MSSLNRVMLIGHLGADPEVKSFQNGGRVCNLRLATSEKWKDKQSGEARERTEWHQISIFSDALVGIAEKYLHKGSKVYIEGQLETRKWQDQSGADRYSTEVVLRPFRSAIVMLDGKPQGDDNRGQERRQESGQDQGGGTGGMDDEIPFMMEWRA